MNSEFATAINCIDGRTQEPLIKWVKDEFQVDYLDLVTLPGPDKKELDDEHRNSVLISRDKHGSKVLVLAGHHDCAGNPVDDETHKSHIVEAVKKLKNMNLGFEAIIGVFVNSDWQVEKVV